MEVWLNDVLVDAKHLELRSWYLKHDKQKPISQYGKHWIHLIPLQVSIGKN